MRPRITARAPLRLAHNDTVCGGFTAPLYRLGAASCPVHMRSLEGAPDNRLQAQESRDRSSNGQLNVLITCKVGTGTERRRFNSRKRSPLPAVHPGQQSIPRAFPPKQRPASGPPAVWVGKRDALQIEERPVGESAPLSLSDANLAERVVVDLDRRSRLRLQTRGDRSPT
jgi:hypothetical protein